MTVSIDDAFRTVACIDCPIAFSIYTNHRSDTVLTILTGRTHWTGFALITLVTLIALVAFFTVLTGRTCRTHWTGFALIALVALIAFLTILTVFTCDAKFIAIAVKKPFCHTIYCDCPVIDTIDIFFYTDHRGILSVDAIDTMVKFYHFAVTECQTIALGCLLDCSNHCTLAESRHHGLDVGDLRIETLEHLFDCFHSTCEIIDSIPQVIVIVTACEDCRKR